MITSNYRNWRKRALYERGAIPMLVDEHYLLGVGFITSDNQEWDEGLKRFRRAPIGTAFFLAVPDDFQESAVSTFAIYAVTTKHTILRYQSDEVINIRVNSTTGGYKDIETQAKDWIKNEHTDVAVCLISSERLTGSLAAGFDFNFIYSQQSQSAYTGFSVGDRVFSIGLFEGFSGKNEIMPISRFGSISLMPHEHEKILAEIGNKNIPINAYLVEMVVWEGQSGSPVFVYFDARTRFKGNVMQLELGPKIERLDPTIIGLVQGYYPIELQKINAGIVIVVPAQDIINTLMDDELVKDREEAKKRKPEPKLKPKQASISTSEPES